MGQSRRLQALEILHAVLGSTTERFVLNMDSGVPTVEGTLDGEPTLFVVDTGAMNAVTIDASFAARRGLALFDTFLRSRGFGQTDETSGGFARISRMSVLGRALQEVDVPVMDIVEPGPRKGRIAGFLGAPFFASGIMALDLSHGTLWIGPRVNPSMLYPRHTLQLASTPTGFPPVTFSLRDAFLSAPLTPMLLLDTGSALSLLTLEYIDRSLRSVTRWVARASFRWQRVLRWRVMLPDGDTVGTRTMVVRSAGDYATKAGLQRVDGLLGADFLKRWISVFDFPARQVYLV